MDSTKLIGWATGILLVQTIIFHALPNIRDIALPQPLHTLSTSLEGWSTKATLTIPQDELDLLHADDTLSRVYTSPGAGDVTLLMAYFKSQKGGVTPHSPKVCLPGGGWVPTDSSRIQMNVADGSPLEINRFVVSRDGRDARLLILYWFQSQNHAIASEYAAKWDSVFRSLFYRRSDTSFVRISTMLPLGEEDKAEKAALSFIQKNYKAISAMLPG
jgi:EpsI family protein